jgi:hypothetical protein
LDKDSKRFIVNRHIVNVYEKLQVRSRAEAVARSVRDAPSAPFYAPHAPKNEVRQRQGQKCCISSKKVQFGADEKQRES